MADRKQHARRAPVLVLSLLGLLALVCGTAAHGAMIKIKVGNGRERAAAFYGSKYGVSRETIERWIRDQERASDTKILDEFELPENAILDFYKVRNAADPAHRVEFQGRGRLISAYSYLGRHYKEILFGLLSSKYRDEAIRLLRQARDQGFMIVPAALETPAGGPVKPLAAQTITVVVIAPEFPHWNDPRPVSNGDTSRFTGDMYYQTGGDFDSLRRYPMAGNNHAFEEWDPDYYADSPGGRMSGGIPLGLIDNGAWSGNPDSPTNDRHPRAGGEDGVYGKPQVTLLNDWFNRVFNVSNANSLTNYYYQNSHGHIRISGGRSDVLGWISDHHILDRVPGPPLERPIWYAVQPGTPLLRPTDPSGPPIVRASLWDGGLTLFFRQDTVNPLAAGLRLWAYQTDINSDADPPINGIVEIQLQGVSTAVMDPWDARRWTILDNGWFFYDLGGDGDPIDFAIQPGQNWYCTTNVPAADTWNTADAGWRAQARGCGALSGTTFTTADVLGSEQYNRLKSYCYYTHDHNFSDASAYQLESLAQPGGYRDDIAGTQELTRVTRPAPFDHDANDDRNYPNMGNVFGGGTPGHSAAAMRSDVFQVLNDQNISWTGYDRIIFLFPDAAQSEGDPNAGIIPHATGGTITVPEGASLALLAHELGHTFGMADLYDNDLYTNALQKPIPPAFECQAAGPYSVMAHGVRVDPWHKLLGLTNGPWAEGVPVLADLGLTQISQVETTLRDPVILKLPAHPLAIYAKKWLDAHPGTVPPGYPGTVASLEALANPANWSEYFLIENRNVTGANYFGDPSPRGLYIWHVDLRNIGGFQMAEPTMSVIPEQADGRYDLETLRTTQGFGDMEGDPFPGSLGNRNFTERSVLLPNGRYSPTSYSHGVAEPGQSPPRTILPGTPTDSFVRVTQISDPGNPMTAYIYVEPAEIIVTQPHPLIPNPTPPNTYYQVKQGTRNFPVMLLRARNDGNYPNLSTKPVVLNNLQVREIGTSLDDANIAAAKLFLDTNDSGQLDVNEDDNGNGILDPGEDRNNNGTLDTANIDTLLATTTLSQDSALFSNLGYTIPLNAQRQFIVAYDVATTAQTNPAITIGAEITEHTDVSPVHPGCVQQRQRRDGTGPGGIGYDFGPPWFPITGRTAQIVEAPDTLRVQSNDLAPATAERGAVNVPMLGLALTVDGDATTITGIRVDQIENAQGGTDVSVVRAYDDANGNGRIDAGEQLLGDGAVVSGVAQITGVTYVVQQYVTRNIILAVNVMPNATLGRRIQLRLVNPSISLAANPNDPFTDQVDYSNFPHTSGKTTIIRRNQPPYPPPSTAPYDAVWVPADGTRVTVTTPDCTFPRARGVNALPPTNAPDPDPEDTGSTIRYVAEFSLDPTFATGVQRENIAAQGPAPDGPDSFTFTVSTALAPGTWYWRVAAIDQMNAQSAWSATHNFVVGNRPTPPNPEFHPNINQDSPVTTGTPTYSWVLGTDVETPPGQLITRVQVSRNPDFSSPLFTADSAPGASSLVNPAATPVEAGRHYYWRARTIDGDGMMSDWVEDPIMHFDVALPSPPTGPFHPNLYEDSPVNTTLPTYSWTIGVAPGSLATQIRTVVQVDDNADFSSPVFTATSAAGASSLVNPASSPLALGGHYFWRVKTVDKNGTESAWYTDATLQFDVVSNRPPGPPQPAFAPSGDIEVQSANPTFSWTAATDPDPSDTRDTLSYELQIDDNDDWSDPNIVITNPPGGMVPGDPDPAVSTVTLNLLAPALADNMRYFWRVRARDAGGLFSDWSDTHSFYVNIVNDPPRRPSQGFSPTNGVTLSTPRPTLRCNQSDAEGKLDPDPFDPHFPGDPPTSVPVAYLTFTFQLRPNDDNWAAGYSYQYTVVASADRYQVAFRIPAGNELSDLTHWFWRVKARDDQGAESGWSDTQHFFIDLNDQPPTLTPPNGDYTQALSPKYGGLSDSYTFRVVYTDAQNDPPFDGVWLELDGNPNKRILMQQTNPGDTNYQDGADFSYTTLGSSSELGIGAHTFRFLTQSFTVEWPGEGDPDAAGEGPILGTRSSLRLADATWTTVVAPNFFEEGSTVYIELTDPDQNRNPNQRETAQVNVTDSGGTDTEVVQLQETGINTGVFRGQIQTLGRAGVSGDDVLNIIAGSGGNTVIASYSDPTQGPDCPPALRDTATATAPLQDHVAPAHLLPPTLRAVSGPNGRTIELDWTGYPETAQIDVARYEIYVETGAFTNLQGLSPRSSVPAGTFSFTVTSLPAPGITPDTDYWVAVVPVDEVPNRDIAVAGLQVRTRDVTPPTLANLNPADGQTQVRVDAPIIFYVVDPGVGIEETTLRAFVNGTEVTSALTRSGTDLNRRCEYRSPTNFNWNQVVTVRVVCDDRSGNHMDQSYSFTVTSDRTGPTVSSQSPAPGATNVAPSTTVTFHITDDISGVDDTSIVVRLNGTDVTSSCTINAGNPLDVVVTYPGAGSASLPWGATISLSVSARDRAGNPLTPSDPTTWSFNVQADNDPPTIANIAPAPNGTGVPPDTEISFRLGDNKSGLDRPTLQVFVNGTQVPTSNLTITGTDSSINVRYAPPSPFAYDQVVRVRVFIRDKSGNILLDENGQATDGYEWQFTCSAAPRYRISGKVTDQSNRPLATVAMTLYRSGTGAALATVTTDGNGIYAFGLQQPGTYRVVPQLDEYDFSPTERQVTVSTQDVTGQDFRGTLRTYNISGRITQAGESKPGVRVSDGTRTAVTNELGVYTLTGVPNGSYTLQPTLAFHRFRPATQVVVVQGSSVTNVNFEAVADTFSIRGTVRDFDGNRIQGVRISNGTESTVTNEAGQFILSDVAAGTYTITATKTGYLFSPETVSVTVPPDQTGVDFTAYLAFSNSFRPGINFIGVPCYPATTDPVAVFGASRLARWNPGGSPPGYVYPGTGASQELLEVRPGRGFFVDLPSGDLRIAGRPVSTSQAFTITLGPIWNMVANMYTSPLPFANIIPGLPGSVRDYGFVYDPATGSYLLVAATPGINVARTHINPWEGLWLRTNGGPATVSISPPARTADATTVVPQALNLGAGGWSIPVVARANDREDRSTVVGVASALPGGLQLDNPPMAPRTVDVYIASADGRYLAQDVRGAAGRTQTWDLVVTTDLPNARVELSLPDLSAVPKNLAVYLTDVETGKRLYARTMRTYAFTSGDNGARRQFKLEVAPRASAGLVISSAAAAPAGGGIAVTCNLSRECQLTVKVTNISGRVVRVLCQDRATPAGVNTLRWDLKSTTGTMVPNGRYLISLEAVGEDGQRVQAVTSAVVRR